MDIYRFLGDLGVRYQRCDHPPVYTVEEVERLVPPLPGAATKNLLVRDRKGKRHFLIVVPHWKTVDLKAVSTLLGCTKLSLASPQRLQRHLGLEPGSVTILGVVNDSEHAVEVVIDQEVWEEESIQCHPLENTATLVIPRQDLERVLQATSHPPRVLRVPQR